MNASAMEHSYDLRQAIESSDEDAIETILRLSPDAANRPISWELNQTNISDPLHYISDCCFNGVLNNGKEAGLARLLLKHGANVNGNDGRESPLIGATSLGVPAVAEVLVAAGADIKLTSIFGANALHWAAYIGLPSTVSLLLQNGAEIETRCTEFGATPLFWAVQGFSRYGPKEKKDQLGAAKVLIDAGASVNTSNVEGTSLLERAGDSDSPLMSDLVEASLAS